MAILIFFVYIRVIKGFKNLAICTFDKYFIIFLYSSSF